MPRVSAPATARVCTRDCWKAISVARDAVIHGVIDAGAGHQRQQAHDEEHGGRRFVQPGQGLRIHRHCHGSNEILHDVAADERK